MAWTLSKTFTRSNNFDTLKSVVTVITLILLFGVAFIVIPNPVSWFEVPKVFIAEGLLAISLLFGIAQFSVKQFQWKKEYYFLVGLFILSLIHLIWFRMPTTLFGNSFRLQGVFLLWLLMGFVVFSQTKLVKTQFKWAVVALGAVSLTTALLGLDTAGRAIGTLGEANSLGAYALFLFPLAWNYTSVKKWKWGIGILTILIVFLSGSRSAFIGFAIQLFFAFLHPKIGVGKATIVSIAILFSTMIFPFLDVQQTFDSRAQIWNTAIEAGRQKPILGWGIGNVEHGLKSTAGDLQNAVRFQYVDSSHNLFLDWWVQGGIVGLGLFSGFVVLGICRMIGERSTTLLASFLGILSVMLFNPVSVAILIPFWTILSIGMKKERNDHRKA